MKIISICGSPRRGNTEWMLGELAHLLGAGGAETELVLVRRLEMKPCRGCLSCEKGGKERNGDCKIKDGMAGILPRLREADIVVFGTPGYFDMLSGQLKTFMDRTLPIWPHLEGKGCAGVAVAEEGIGQAIENIRTYSALLKMRWLGSATALAKTPGQVAGDRAAAGALEQLAKRLLSFIP